AGKVAPDACSVVSSGAEHDSDATQNVVSAKLESACRIFIVAPAMGPVPLHGLKRARARLPEEARKFHQIFMYEADGCLRMGASYVYLPTTVVPSSAAS